MAYLWGTNGVAAFWYVLRPLLGQVGLTPVVSGVILFFSRPSRPTLGIFGQGLAFGLLKG